jgi:hypothetical protein
MMYIGLAGVLLIVFGLSYILSAFGAIWLGNFFFWLADSWGIQFDRERHASVVKLMDKIADRRATLTTTVDLRIEELIHAGELEQALLLAHDQMREMHLQGRAGPEALYRRYVDELTARLAQESQPPR